MVSPEFHRIPPQVWWNPHHIIQRGNNRSACFFTKEDYRFYLQSFSEGAGRYGCDVHAYVLMTNHVHLLAMPEDDEGLSHKMRYLGSRYVQYVNHVYRRSGTLWEGRFKSSLIDSDRYLLTCYRYIELNPVRAGMVAAPGRLQVVELWRERVWATGRSATGAL